MPFEVFVSPGAYARLRRAAVLAYIRAYVARHGGAPTLRQIADDNGFGGTTAALHHVRTLIRLGYLRRITPDRSSRNLALTGKPGLGDERLPRAAQGRDEHHA